MASGWKRIPVNLVRRDGCFAILRVHWCGHHVRRYIANAWVKPSKKHRNGQRLIPRWIRRGEKCA